MKKTLICLLILLGITFKAEALGIYCPECKRHLYNYIFKEINIDRTNAKYFYKVEAPKDPVDTDRFVCPFDGTPLNGYEYWFWKRGLSAPKIIYPALTVFSYAENDIGVNEFQWVPEEVNLEE